MDRKTKIIFVVAIVAIVVLYYQFLWVPLSRRLNVVREEYQGVSTELRKTEAVAARLEEVQARYDRLLNRWEGAKVMLPKEKEIPSLLEGITTAGMRSGIKFDLFEPQALLPRGIYSEVPIKVSIAGNFHEVASFLSAVGNLPRIVNVADLQLREGKERKLSVDLRAITYVITEGGGAGYVE